MAKAGKFCLVYYYVPEDKDDPEFPNAFGLNQSIDEIKIADIRKMFPLAGDYIFRFKVKLANSTVWMDIKEESKIPHFNGKIMMKATRISWESRGNPQRHNQESIRQESNVPAETNGHSYHRNMSASSNQQAQKKGPTDAFGDADINLLSTAYMSTSAPLKTGGSKTQTQNLESHDLLDFTQQPSNGNSYKLNQETNKKPDLLSFDNLF